jgi:tetratricopeptide (TPR) repeat protein
MVGQVAAQNALSEDIISAVVERTSGVPLFVEELTRAVLESSGGSLGAHGIPVTLHDSLMARLDRLGPAKEVAQVASVIGADFSYVLLEAVSSKSADELQLAMARLADAELIYTRGIPPDASYQFKHNLIRDAAYEALLKSRRKELHRLVASAIQEKFPALKDAHPEILARHWTEAGEAEAGVNAWQEAGDRAVAGRAYVEADQHYRDALGALEMLPQSEDRDGRELTIQLSLGKVMEATRGWTADETKAVYGRARILAQRAGDATSVEAFNAFNGLQASAVLRGQLQQALTLADQMLELASRTAKPRALIAAHFAKGLTRYYLGDLINARAHFLSSIEHNRQFSCDGKPVDAGVRALNWSGPNEWHLGYPDRALRYANEALSIARQYKNPFGLASTLAVSAQVYEFRGDFKNVLQTSEEALRVSTASRFPLWKAICKVQVAWARAKMGETAGVVEQIRQALAEMDALEFHAARGRYLGLLCEIQALMSAFDDAQATADQAVLVNPDGLLYRPYALCLRGELYLRDRGTIGRRPDLAEKDFRLAIEIARRMAAKSEELRATIRLAGMLASEGCRDNAHTMLAEIYNWFTEGFDTADLKEAKALLNELSR